MKFLLPLAIVLGLGVWWFQRQSAAVLEETQSSEEESLEPEFAVQVDLPERKPPLQRIAEDPPEPADEPEVTSAQAPQPESRQARKPETPGRETTAPQSAKQPATGPREEIVGGTKNIYGDDGQTLVETGGWQNNQRQGYWQRFDAEGRVIATENYVDGQLDGLAESWYPDGKRRSSVPMQAGQVHGRAQYWLPSGELDTQKSGTYENGERVSD